MTTTPARTPNGAVDAESPRAVVAAGSPNVATGPGAPADPEMFRSVMRHHAKSVAVITTGVHTPVGFCATSLTSLSLDPPLVSFTVGLRSSSWPRVQDERHVVVHLLAADQVEIAQRFATSGAPRFGPETRWYRGVYGLPVLAGVLAWMVVEPVSRMPVGDHVLVIGRVVAARHGTGRRPLIHHNGQFIDLS